MARILIGDPIVSDLATVSLPVSTFEDVGFPATNLLRRHVTDVFRSSAAVGSEIRIEFDLGSAQTIGLIWLGYTNASASATWRVKAAVSQAGLDSAPTLNTGTMTLWPDPGFTTWNRVHARHWIGTTGHSARWWQVRVRDDANADGYFEAARLYLTNPWQPAQNMKWGVGYGREDGSVDDRQESGSLFTDPRGQWRKLVFDLDLQSEAELWANVERLDRLRGTARDVLVVTDIDDAPHFMQKTLYARQSEIENIIWPHHGIYRRRFRFDEMEHP